MKKQSLSVASVLVTSIILSACTTLKSQHYLGEIEPVSEKDLSSETVWMQGDDVYFVKRIDSNTVVAATMEWDAKTNDFSVRSFPLILSQLEDHIFLNVKEDDLYTILRLARGDDDSILLFTIDSDQMTKDIADGKVKAHKDNGNFIMDGSKEEQDAYMLKNIDTIFSMNSASVVKKIAAKKKH